MYIYIYSNKRIAKQFCIKQHHRILWRNTKHFTTLHIITQHKQKQIKYLLWSPHYLCHVLFCIFYFLKGQHYIFYYFNYSSHCLEICDILLLFHDFRNPMWNSVEREAGLLLAGVFGERRNCSLCDSMWRWRRLPSTWGMHSFQWLYQKFKLG